MAQGNIHGVKGTDTISFIQQQDVPRNREVTYATYVLDHRPLKAEKYRVRMTVGGDKLTYPFDDSSHVANLLATKLRINSTISDTHTGARFMSADIIYYLLASLIERPECMRVKHKNVQTDIKKLYNLVDKITQDGYIYIKRSKGMYGLK